MRSCTSASSRPRPRTSWRDAIGYLLRRAAVPVDVVLGMHAFTGDDADWGYGPPRYLTAQEVTDAAIALTALPFVTLGTGVSPAELTAADVYPLLWDGPDALDFVRSYYEPLSEFFSAAAAAGDSMLIWLA